MKTPEMIAKEILETDCLWNFSSGCKEEPTRQSLIAEAIRLARLEGERKGYEMGVEESAKVANGSGCSTCGHLISEAIRQLKYTEGRNGNG